MNNQQIRQRVEALIAEGRKVVASPSKYEPDMYVDSSMFHKWCASCRALIHSLGRAAEPWRRAFDGKFVAYRHEATELLANIESILEAIDTGMLRRVEDLVYADAFADLMEQADHLLEKDFVLAAGVILRAVLEERLKLLCDRNGCLPTKDRPTIADYKQELYKAGVIDKVAMMGIEAMAAIGNHCAHNADPPLRKPDVEGFRRNLADFLFRYSA